MSSKDATTMTPLTTAVGFIQSLNTFFSLFWRIISSHRHTSVKPTFLLLHFSFQVNSQQQQTLCELSFLKEGTPAFQHSRESSGGHTTSTDYFEKWVHGNFISQIKLKTLSGTCTDLQWLHFDGVSVSIWSCYTSNPGDAQDTADKNEELCLQTWECISILHPFHRKIQNRNSTLQEAIYLPRQK